MLRVELKSRLSVVSAWPVGGTRQWASRAGGQDAWHRDFWTQRAPPVQQAVSISGPETGLFQVPVRPALRGGSFSPGHTEHCAPHVLCLDVVSKKSFCNNVASCRCGVRPACQMLAVSPCRGHAVLSVVLPYASVS